MITKRILATIMVCAMTAIGGIGTSVAQTSMRLGLQPYLSNAGFFIALEKGYFAQEGIDIKLAMSRASGAELISGLISDQYDVLGTGLTLATYNALLRGIDIKIIADKGGEKGDQSFTWLVVRKELMDNNRVKTLADLKGLRIGAPGVGTAYWIEAMMLLDGAGVKASEVEMIRLNPPDTVASLKSGTIDAAMLGEPFVSQIVTAGNAAALAPGGKDGHFVSAVIMATGEQVKKNREALKRFLKAYIKGTQEYFANPRDAKSVEAIMKYTKLNRTVVEGVRLPYIDPKGIVHKDVIERQMRWLVNQNLLSEMIPTERFIDNSLLPK